MPETRRSYIGHVPAFYWWAIEAGVLAADPSSRLTTPRLTPATASPDRGDDCVRPGGTLVRVSTARTPPASTPAPSPRSGPVPAPGRDRGDHAAAPVQV